MNEIVTKTEFFETYKLNFYANKAGREYGHLFPICSSIKLAEIVASLLTDGFMDVKDYHNSKKFSYIGFFSKNEQELIDFGELINNLFGIKGEIKEWGVRHYGESKGYIINKSILTRILYLCGVVGGDKIVQKYNVPEWIKKSDKKIKAAFLRRSFSCEGSVSYDIIRKKCEIRYSMYKSMDLLFSLLDYLNDLRDLLEEFGISSYICKKEEYIRDKDNEHIIGLCIKISNWKSLINYAKYVGFDIDYKKQRLSEILIIKN